MSDWGVFFSRPAPRVHRSHTQQPGSPPPRLWLANPLAGRNTRAPSAGAALLAVATTVHRTAPRRRDVLRIAGLGLCLFLNQLLFILGLFLAGVTLASCMQPTIPVFTSVLSMICRQEPPSSRRLAGALSSCADTRHSRAVSPIDSQTRSPLPPSCVLCLLVSQTSPEALARRLIISEDSAGAAAADS